MKVRLLAVGLALTATPALAQRSARAASGE